jgi:hypothetical protein
VKKALLVLLLCWFLGACNNSADMNNPDNDAPGDIDYPVTTTPPDSAAFIPDSARTGLKSDSMKDTLSVKFPDKKQ